ncbi:helix-turn-helix domain-containing protein [Rhizobium sp. PP-CC-3G-465]|uniref:helix-turn-helix domain-containing protein n=1 Tax=Rhizobium sp. PP-CC-3G-465 TaxID=2135648 RepID=UPI0010476C1A|nr:helix-turn-helix protein [Rhizobium sp. PP-CC-3G-465]
METEDVVDLSNVISARELYALRKSADMTQSMMANELGLTLRGYQKLESGESPMKPLHGKAAMFVLIERMAQGHVPEDAGVRRIVERAHFMMNSVFG